MPSLWITGSSLSLSVCFAVVAAVQISEISPFVFFHQRKTAGSTIRQRLFDIALARNLSAYIPCHAEAHCETYVIDQQAAVYGGHFYWGSLAFLQKHTSGVSGSNNFSCMTVFRDPVKRLHSCLHFRYITEGLIPGLDCISELPIADIAELVWKGRDMYGMSCRNEPFRIFSGVSDEEMLLEPLATHPGAIIFQSTVKHIDACVSVFLDNSASIEHFDSVFPQLSGLFRDLPVMNQASKNCSVTHAMASLFARATRDETVLFELLQKNMLKGTIVHIRRSHKRFKARTTPVDYSGEVGANRSDDSLFV